jgi:hypothetical protein
MRLIFDDDCESMSDDDDFFSVARTMPLVAVFSSQPCSTTKSHHDIPLIPSEVTPWLTALRAYSVAVLDTVCYVDHETLKPCESAYLSAPAYRYIKLANMSYATDRAVFTWARMW